MLNYNISAAWQVYGFAKCGFYLLGNTKIVEYGSFIIKKRAAKIGRNIKKNIAVSIPEHFIPAFKPAKEFVQEVKTSPNIKEAPPVKEEGED
ncbi:MAG TPA: HU family DNA-binding protein [Ferruginibacter sp.]|nr:HU family DNA-binding protein [Ferruginibacter sp.]